MDTVLLAVTILSLAIALAMAFIVARLMREERTRSEARVAALTAMVADVPAAVVPPAVAATPAPPAGRAIPRPVLPEPVPGAEGHELDDLDLRTSKPAVAGVSHLFEEAVAPSPWGRRFAVIGTLAAVVIAVSAVLASMQPRATADASPAVSTQRQPVVLDSAPLELVSLQHTQEAQRLVIRGLVQNPRTGGAISHVVATAFLFGPDGAFLTSSRAPLDFTTLSPGDESAFVINVPVTGPVARYRVGFRTGDGRVIEHVDKRVPDALAQK
jgi:hypothetical protein